MSDCIISEEGINELDKYFIEHKDPLMKVAWKNLKDKYVRPHNGEFIPNFHKCMHKEIRNDVEFCHYHDKEIHTTLDEHDKQVRVGVLRVTLVKILEDFRMLSFNATSQKIEAISLYNAQEIVKMRLNEFVGGS